MKSGLEDALTNKLEMLLKFENKLLSQLNSLISSKLVGLLQKSFICSFCQIKTYSFSGFFHITLDLQKIPNQFQINIENYFAFRNNSFNNTEKYCPKCLTKTKHQVYKKFFTSPDNLIATINRGSNDLDRRAVILKPIIDLTKLTVSIGRKYKLVGFITKDYKNEKYISYFEFRMTGKWFKSEDRKIIAINQNEYNNSLNDINGQTIMAFYEAI
jgi:ubiquitin C-terminal hydrolase